MVNHFLTDVDVYRNSPFYGQMLSTNPALRLILQAEGLQVVRLYQARVGRKTGRLMASAEAWVEIGGHENDRQIGKVTIADSSVAGDWKGKPFYYGVFHESGTDGGRSGRGRGSKRAKRRKTESRGPKPGYHELREVAQEWRGI